MFETELWVFSKLVSPFHFPWLKQSYQFLVLLDDLPLNLDFCLSHELTISRPSSESLCVASRTSEVWLRLIFIIPIETAWPQSLSSVEESPYLGLWWASFLIVLLSVQESEWVVIRVSVTQSLSMLVKNISATTEKFPSFKKPDQVYIISLLLVFHMSNAAIAMGTTTWWASLY